MSKSKSLSNGKLSLENRKALADMYERTALLYDSIGNLKEANKRWKLYNQEMRSIRIMTWEEQRNK